MFNNDYLNINQEQREELNKITSRECLQAKNCELLDRYSYNNCTWLKLDEVYKLHAVT